MKNVEKDDRITYLKAIGIILMVLGHCGCSIPFVVQFIYMFHMPLFFFASGYCFKTKYLESPMLFIWKRIKGVWIPYVKYSLIFLVLHNVFFDLNIYNSEIGFLNNVAHEYVLTEMSQRAFSIVTSMTGHEQLLGGYWFLKSLFVGSIVSFVILYFINKIIRIHGISDKKTPIMVGGFLLLLLIVFNKFNIFVPYIHVGSLEMVAGTIYLTGYIFSTFNVKQFNGLCIFACLVLTFVGSIFWPVSLADGAYVNFSNKVIIPYIITALLSTWSLYSLPWHCIGGRIKKLILFIGNNTLSILTWHFLCFKLMSFIIIMITGRSLIQLGEFPVLSDFSNKGGWVLYLLVGIIIPVGMTYIFRNKFCVLNNRLLTN